MSSNNSDQFCLNGMSGKIFEFSGTEDGKKCIDMVKAVFSTVESRKKEFLIAYNSFYVCAAIMKMQGLPATTQSIFETIKSENFHSFSVEIAETVNGKYSQLIDRLNKSQKVKFHNLFV